MGAWVPPRLPGPPPDDVACFLTVSTPTGLASWWEGPEPSATVRSETAAFARGVSAAPLLLPDDADEAVVLRLRVRRRPLGQAATDAADLVVDVDFGPMGAPADYPRVSVDDLFRHAAESA